jgi:hypothetical protein
VPVLGLIFLRYADHKFAIAEKELSGKGSGRRGIGKEDYQAKGVMFLPPQARFSKLLTLPEGENIGKAINEAMKAVEAENEDLKGVLPKTAEGENQNGRTLSFSCWRSSDISQDNAHESALAIAKRILDFLLAGRKLDRYPYGCLPLREEVVNKLVDAQGNLFAAVTRNSLGSLVLNTERVMFVDIDFPLVFIGERTTHFFARLFGLGKNSPEAKREEQAKAGLEQFLAQNPKWGLRLYRTFAGFRGIVMHDIFDPTSDQAIEALRHMGSDPLYVRLCKFQECFRARLSPKPWRCGHRNNTIQYP